MTTFSTPNSGVDPATRRNQVLRSLCEDWRGGAIGKRPKGARYPGGRRPREGNRYPFARNPSYADDADGVLLADTQYFDSWLCPEFGEQPGGHSRMGVVWARVQEPWKAEWRPDMSPEDQKQLFSRIMSAAINAGGLDAQPRDEGKSPPELLMDEEGAALLREAWKTYGT